jgi:hypothetical protein
VDETPATNPTDASAERGPDDGQPAQSQPVEQPGFRSRGRARRRARFLRRARELAYRDLGGLVYNLHRFGQRNDPLVLAKLNTLSTIDGELRTIEAALADRRPITVLREAGITACPRCAAIHGSEDRFCPNCGLPMSRHADLPVAGAPAAGAPAGDGAGSQTGQHAAQPAAAPAPASATSTGATPGAGAVPAGAGAPAPTAATASPSTAAEPARSSQAATAKPGVPAGVAGRSPAPPARPDAQDEAGADGGRRPGTDEPTEIIRPPASGS